MHNIYISGIINDKVYIEAIKDLVEKSLDNVKCWVDVVQDNSSLSYGVAAKKEMPSPNEYEIAIYVASKESRQSEWVFRELTYFMKMEIPLFAVIVDDLDFPTASRSRRFKGFCSKDNHNSLLSFVRQNIKNEEEYDVFISYSRKDSETVNGFRQMLESYLPGLRCWFDLDGIESGDEFEGKIVSAIEKSKILLFAVSNNSMESEYAQREVTFAHNLGKRIVPVVIDGSKLSGWFLFRFGNISYTDIQVPEQLAQLLQNLGNWFRLEPNVSSFNAAASYSCASRDIVPEDSEQVELPPSPAEIIVNLDSNYDGDASFDDWDGDCCANFDAEEDSDYDISMIDVNANGNIDDLYLETIEKESHLQRYEEQERRYEIEKVCRMEETHPKQSINLRRGQSISFSKTKEDTEFPTAVHNTEFSGNLVKHDRGFFSNFCGKLKNVFGHSESDSVHSCVYAPAQAKVGDEILVQVFLHLPSEVADVECQAKSVDASARKRNSKQLSIALKNGDIIDIVLSIPTININQICKSICWKGRFESVEFAFSIPENCSKDSLLSTIVLLKQHIPVAEMSFKIELVSNPSKAYAEIFGHIFRRTFISYSHKDIATVEPIANQLRNNGIDYFFDKHTLKSGDMYRNKIREWLELSDLFILC